MTHNKFANKLMLSIDTTATPVIHAYGELDYRNCERLRAFLHQVIVERGPLLSLELGGLDFVDSSGVKALVVGAREAENAGGSVTLLSLAPQLLRALEVTGFKELFVIPETCRLVRVEDPGYPAEVVPRDFRIPAGVEECRRARDSVCELAEILGFGESAVDDIRLAVGEAFSNAVRHGQAEKVPIHIQCRQIEDRFLIELKYRGDIFSPEDVPLPTAESGCNGGMGIYFMRLVMDAIEYDFRDGYTHLVLEKRRAQ